MSENNMGKAPEWLQKAAADCKDVAPWSNDTVALIDSLRSERDDLAARVAILENALGDAAMSLKTLSDLAGSDAFLKDAVQIRGYANNCSECAFSALSLPTLGAADRLKDEIWREAERLALKGAGPLTWEEVSDCGNSGDIYEAGWSDAARAIAQDFRLARPSAFEGDK